MTTWKPLAEDPDYVRRVLAAEKADLEAGRDLSWAYRPLPGFDDAEPADDELVISSIEEFAAVDEPGSAALVGDEGDALIAEGSPRTPSSRLSPVSHGA